MINLFNFTEICLCSLLGTTIIAKIVRICTNLITSRDEDLSEIKMLSLVCCTAYKYILLYSYPDVILYTKSHEKA